MDNLNPPPALRATRIPTSVWEKHREGIYALYVEGKTLEQVMSAMRSQCLVNECSFNPTYVGSTSTPEQSDRSVLS